MTSPTSTREWILSHAPSALPSLSGPTPTFTLRTSPLPPLQPNQLLLRTLYISNDPAQRGWITKDIDPARLYVPPVHPGDIMRARAIAQVVSSTSAPHPPGTLLLATTGWAEYSVLDAAACQPIDEIPGLSVTHFLGALGMTGLTAYYGAKIVAGVGPGDTVVVSGAAGATGSMVVQIARKMLGCGRVVGIAGSEEKCRWVERLGADVCLNYKSEAFERDLVRETEGYVEVYFDNVGGRILDLMLTRMKKGGRVAACGAIEEYNQGEGKRGVRNWFEIISNRIQIRGFIVLDFVMQPGKAREAVGEMVQAFKEGKISIGEESETVVETGFENVPATWMKLFEGANTGKLVTKLV